MALLKYTFSSSVPCDHPADGQDIVNAPEGTLKACGALNTMELTLPGSQLGLEDVIVHWCKKHMMLRCNETTRKQLANIPEGLQ